MSVWKAMRLVCLEPSTRRIVILSGVEPDDDDNDVYYYIRWRLKLEGETENMGVCNLKVH